MEGCKDGNLGRLGTKIFIHNIRAEDKERQLWKTYNEKGKTVEIANNRKGYAFVKYYFFPGSEEKDTTLELGTSVWKRDRMRNGSNSRKE